MPRIDAPTVAEHHARQRDRILDSAFRLFIDRGVHAVGMAEIAEDAGLRRNSLYRYFSSRDDIVVALFERDLPEYLLRSETILTQHRPPLERLLTWADDQISYAVDPTHALAGQLLGEATNLSEDAMAVIADGHRQIMRAVHDTVAACLNGLSEAETDVLTELIGAAVLAAARHAIEHGATPTLRRMLRQALSSILTDQDPASDAGPGVDGSASRLR